MKIRALIFSVAVIVAMSPTTPEAKSQGDRSGSGPALWWFLDGAILEAPGHEMMLMLPEDRPYSVDVDVSIDFHFKNDDGTQGEQIGTTTEGTSSQTVSYNQTGQHAHGLGFAVGTAAAGLVGQEVGYQVAQKASEAAANAAASASPLNPTHQWGNWFSSAASTGRNLAGRLVGALGGIS